MMRIGSIAVLIVGLTLACVGVSSAHEVAPFIDPDALNIASMLPPPPADGSAAQQSELAMLHKIQQSRTPAQIAAAESDADVKSMAIFRQALGIAFSPQELPMTMALSHDVTANVPSVLKSAKLLYDRERPFVADPTLHSVCPADSASYPSSHTTNVYLQANVLAAMVPEMREAIFARAANYAYNRLICGVHYPSDVQAGKNLAQELMGPIMHNPTFQLEFARAQIELRHALNLPALNPSEAYAAYAPSAR